MTFEQLYRILKARRILAATVFLTFITVAVLLSILLPKSYKATATVMVDLKPDPVSGLSQLATMQPATYLATQVDIIKSDHVAQRVVKLLGLSESAETRKQWQDETSGRGNFDHWLGEVLQKGLEVEPSRDSNIIEIHYNSRDPKFAAALADAFSRAYIESLVQMKVDPARRYSDFFEERARLAREKLEKAQTRLAEAQRQSGILVTDERLDAETTRLNEMGAQLVGIRGLLAESKSRSSVGASRVENLQDVLNNPVVAALKADLARNQAKLEEVSAQFGDNHPTVIQYKASIAELKHRVQLETQRIGSGVGTSNSINLARDQAATQAYDEQRAKLLKMKEQRTQLALMEKEVESAQRVYEAIQLRQNQSSLESNANQSSVYQLSAATEPIKPSSPKLLLNLFIAFFGGGIATLLITLVAELMDRRVRAVIDVVQTLELPVIGTMPGPVSKQKHSLIKQNILTPITRTLSRQSA
jgi:succinoglycan biosynthesis transport protein ExoP